MRKIVLFTSIALFSGIGWALGAKFGVMTGYWLSFAGSLLGVYVGVRVNQTYLR